MCHTDVAALKAVQGRGPRKWPRVVQPACFAGTGLAFQATRLDIVGGQSLRDWHQTARGLVAKLLLLDIDGTLTDATTDWAGPELGWIQRYSVRDGEALLRLRAGGLAIAALSRNRTRCAKERVDALGIDSRWLGVRDKDAGLTEAMAAYAVDAVGIAYVGDGLEDADIFARVGLGIAVHDAHPIARQAAHHVLARRGGDRAIEELESYLSEIGWLSPVAIHP